LPGAGNEEGIASLVAELGAEDDARFAAALGTSREFSVSSVTEALVGRLAGLSPARQALLVAVLGDRGDAAARPGGLRAAASSAPEVRVAATHRDLVRRARELLMQAKAKPPGT